MFYLNIKWFMANLLERKDRMSMACGLEVRVPFCDHRIAEYAWNIPWDIMNAGGMEKGILRLAVADSAAGCYSQDAKKARIPRLIIPIIRDLYPWHSKRRSPTAVRPSTRSSTGRTSRRCWTP